MPPLPRDDDDLLDDYSDEAATFGDRLGHAREAMGLSLPEFAKRMGVRPRTLRDWEEDRAEPRANRLQMLAGLLNAPLPWLMTGQGAAPAQAEAPGGGAARACLAELRRLRADQARLVERMARLEKRLMAALDDPRP